MTLSEERPSDELKGPAAVRAVNRAWNAPKPSTNGVDRIVIVKRDPKPPKTSWWLEQDFAAAYKRELPRLLKESASQLPTRTGEPTRP